VLLKNPTTGLNASAFFFLEDIFRVSALRIHQDAFHNGVPQYRLARHGAKVPLKKSGK
jgi:hypothetical protein